MTSAAVSRLIKEELLNSAYPEVYRNIKRVAPKSIRKIKKAPKEEIKIEIKPKKRNNRISVDAAYRDAGDDDVEIVRALAPRRPYQWRGRKVNKILRPGTVIQFTPGQRVGRPTKRAYDEVYADEDILQQAEQQVGEFAYGKRPRIEEAIILDSSNDTPSLAPVTPQFPIVPMAGKKRAIELQPTVQMMVPSKRAKIVKSEIADIPTAMNVDLPDTGPSSLFTIPAPVKKEAVTNMEIDNITVRPVKRVTSDIGVQTIDLKVPTPNIYGPASKVMPQGVRYHPSITIGPKVIRRRRRRRRQSRRRKAPSSVGIIPQVTYHPTINP